MDAGGVQVSSPGEAGPGGQLGRVTTSMSLLVALLCSVVAVGMGQPGAAAVEPPASWSTSQSSAKVEPGIDLAARGTTSLIVQAFPGRELAVRDVIQAAGGIVEDELELVHGFEVALDGPQVAQVAASAAVRSVSVDHRVDFEELTYEDSTTASNFARTSEATSSWAAGRLGAGVGVAVLDTGVSSMADFDGRIAFGPDLSGEGVTTDTHGHGTVMAGIVAGDGTDSAGRAGGAFTGVAPRATLVPIKVAGRNGAVDVSTMLQAMHWVSAYKDQFNIRVMNLSWGSTSKQGPALDPLNYAVQRLWQEGIVVVVAAGNSGPQAGTVHKPGDDPLVLTVGAFDDKQNSERQDDSLAPWSSRGPTAAGLTKPDIVAPGRLITATRSFGSRVEQSYPKALVSPSYIRGSGTSEAAAVTSGLVALLLEEHPSLTPDQVKSVITRSGAPLADHGANSQGGGRVQLNRARALAAVDPGPAAWQRPTAIGTGSIEASRGGVNVETDCEPDGVVDVIRGEIDVRCEAWAPDQWVGSRWTGSAWTGAEWTGSRWTGSRWTGSAWTEATWTGSRWTGGEWTGSAWNGSAWTGSAWTGSRWTGSRWTGSRWTGSRWTGSRWKGSRWTTAEHDEFTSLAYGATPSFLNAFWGLRPAAGQRLSGEIAEDQLPASVSSVLRVI